MLSLFGGASSISSARRAEEMVTPPTHPGRRQSRTVAAASGAPAPLARRFYCLLVALSTPFLTGCPGHEARVQGALDALDRGSPEEALVELNDELEVERVDDLPEDVTGDNALLLLDRATVLQSLGDYDLSQRDFGVADKSIEILDLDRNAAHDVGKYLFSDDVGPYRAPPFEKLLINTFNMMNYLARGDLSGARVEARRLGVMQRYLTEQQEQTTLLGLGSWLAGLTFEKSGKPDEALRYYEDALQYQGYGSLRDPLRVLTGGQPKSPRVDALVQGAALPSPAEAGEAEIVVVVGYGRVPQKKPTRIPIGLALTLVAGHISPRDNEIALQLAAQGLVTWVNFPRLGKARGSYEAPQLFIDQQPAPLEHALDIEAEVRREWDESEPTIILAAITRLITRAVAGGVVQAATGAAVGRKNGGAALGLLAGLATQAALVAADTPDTRSWATLPSQVALGRLRVPPGRHSVRIAARGHVRDYDVTLRAGDFAFVQMSALR
jgi:hypothetical protein